MPIPIGGRGHKVGYETRTVRVPMPLLPPVRRLIAQFHGDMELEKSGKLPTLNEATVEAAKILKSKKSARQSIQALLKRLYETDDVEL